MAKPKMKAGTIDQHHCHCFIGLVVLGLSWLVTGLFVGIRGLWILGLVAIVLAIVKKLYVRKMCGCCK